VLGVPGVENLGRVEVVQVVIQHDLHVWRLDTDHGAFAVKRMIVNADTPAPTLVDNR
jgi:hypothetical protein